jgi:copper chaperone CopZ
MSVESIQLKHEGGCQVTPVYATASEAQLAQASVLFLAVEGMGCPTCTQRVRNGLLQIQGVLDASVELDSGLAKVWFDDGVVTPATVAADLPAAASDARHSYTARLLAVRSPREEANHGILR